jgi:hypothetical protein
MLVSSREPYGFFSMRRSFEKNLIKELNNHHHEPSPSVDSRKAIPWKISPFLEIEIYKENNSKEV